MGSRYLFATHGGSQHKLMGVRGHSNRKSSTREDVLIDYNLYALTNETFIHDRKRECESGASKSFRVERYVIVIPA